MLIPKQQKYKKQQKGKSINRIGKSFSLNFLHFGTFILKSLELGRLSSKELEALFQTLNKFIKKTGRVLLKVFPHTPLCKKPVEVRMGKGKGNVSSWVAKIKPGTIICEVITINSSIALKALTQAKQKLSLKTKII